MKKNSGYHVVDKSKDYVSKDEIYKTHQNRMISNHEENRSNKMNYEESSTYKIEESSTILMINKTIEESTGSYFNKLKKSFDTEKRKLSHGVREYSRDEIYGRNDQVQNKYVRN